LPRVYRSRPRRKPVELWHLRSHVSRQAGPTAIFEDAKRLTADLPEVAESTSYRTPALKVRGSAFCRMWNSQEHDRDQVHDTEVLVVFCDPNEKAALIESAGGVLFSTPHYDGYGAMLVRLSEIAMDDLADYLETSYRVKAPPSLRRILDS